MVGKAGRVASALALVAALAASARAEDPAAHAARLVKSAIIVDTHEDVPWELRESCERQRAAVSAAGTARGSTGGAGGARQATPCADLAVAGATKHVDLPRMRQGGLGAAFFAVFTPGELADKGQAAHVAFELSDLVDRVVAAHPRDLAAATSVAEIRAAHRSGRIAILKGIEGGHAIESSLGLLRDFYRLGVRYMTLTHTNTNDWADSLGNFTDPAYDPAKWRKHGGLTAFGKEVVAEMNRLGMAVDVSHVSPETLRDVLAVSTAPPFASHSSCRALTDNPRNLTDEQIVAIARAGGVVMINASSSFLDADGLAAARARPQRDYHTTLSRYVDHLEHALKLAPGAVGLGTDFDGIGDPPKDFADVSYFPKLVEELLRRGHPDAEVRGLLGESFLAYLSRVERATKAPDEQRTAR